MLHNNHWFRNKMTHTASKYVSLYMWLYDVIQIQCEIRNKTKKEIGEIAEFY